METINCPVCGEVNPADRENCQQCGLPLRQSTSELDGGGITIEAGAAPSQKDTAELESALPAWLKSARQGEDKKPAPSAPKEEEKAEEEPPSLQADEPEEEEDDNSLDWLAGLAGDDSLEDEEDEVADWLVNLQTDLEEDESKEETPPAPPVADETLIRAGDLPLPSDEEEPLPETGELPDWISNLQESAESTQADPSLSFDDFSDEGESFQPPPVEEREDTVESGGLPDWLATLAQEADASASSVGQPATASQADAQPEEPAAASDLPDWMSDLQSATQDAAPAEETESPTSSGDDLPDWLGGDEPSAAQPEETAAASDLPDWMAGLEPATDHEDESAVQVEDDGLPDWLGGEASAVEAADAAASLGGEDFPDWLSSVPAEDLLGDEKEADKLSFEGDVTERVASERVSDSLLPKDDDFPDWLSAIEKPVTGALDPSNLNELRDEADALPDEESPARSGALDGIDEEDELAPTPAFVGEEQVDDDEIFGIEMPDWLSRLSPDEVDEADLASETDEVGAEEELPDAQLPSWVQAMRPVESVVTDSSQPVRDDVAPQTGPLAGLSGVLPSTPGLGQINKPKAYSVKLQVSESQQKSAAVLEEILAEENQPAFSGGAAAKIAVPLVRWVIAVLLFAVLGFSVFSQSKMTPSPQFVLPEVQDAIGVINQLPAEGTALIVFDYEAGFSGEMEAVALPLMDHLMSRGQKMAFLSTTPMGPGLAEDFLTKTQSADQYARGDHFVNLGYLSGNAAGMASFLNNPKSLASVSTNGGALMSEINHADDFSVIVILTDDVEKGRFWIEQSAFVLETTPLLMAVSAQVEPIVYPYYASGQVDGLVSGLSGGATYERMQGRDGLSRRYWDAYSLGLLIAEILIPIGALINFMAALRARQKTKRKEK